MHKIPLVLFAAVAVLCAVLLLKGRNPAEVPSVLIGKPAPDLSLPPALKGIRGIAPADLKGAPRLVNFFASWCVPCAAELKLFQGLEGVEVYGVAYKDDAQKLRRWLQNHGAEKVFVRLGDDPQGLAAIDWGVTGVPETFLVDARGVIRHKHVGPLTAAAWRENFLPLLAEMKK